MSVAELGMLAAKVILVGMSVGLATLAARRGGHAVAGLLSGMPMIIGPIMALLLIDTPPAHVGDIAGATLRMLPAMLAHSLAFAALATRGRAWPVCLLGANGAFLLTALALNHAPWSGAWAIGTATIVPGALMLSMPRLAERESRRRAPDAENTPRSGGVAIPPSEVAWRIAAAMSLAAAVIASAQVLPVWISGALLALPIAGNVLPAFTLPRHGVASTLMLLGGFGRGLHGFVAFLAVLTLALPAWPPAGAWLAGIALALSTGVVTGWRPRRLPVVAQRY